MDDELWARRALPDPGTSPPPFWAGAPSGSAQLSAQRAQLRAVVDGSDGASGADVDRLLLAFEELGSNGLRHGQPPIRISVVTTGTGWVLDVSDGAVEQPPSPAVDRDPAEGGLGLYLIARLACGHGWDVHDGRKHVWACIEFGTEGAAR
jgi:signal transduction histidine kinase